MHMTGLEGIAAKYCLRDISVHKGQTLTAQLDILYRQDAQLVLTGTVGCDVRDLTCLERIVAKYLLSDISVHFQSVEGQMLTTQLDILCRQDAQLVARWLPVVQKELDVVYKAATLYCNIDWKIVIIT